MAQGPTLEIRSAELEQRQLKLEGAQLISRAALEKHWSAHRGSWETRSGSWVEVGPEGAVADGRKDVRCAAALPAARATRDKLERCILTELSIKFS